MKAYPIVTVALIGFILAVLYFSGNNAVEACQELHKGSIELLQQCPTLKG